MDFSSLLNPQTMQSAIGEIVKKASAIVPKSLDLQGIAKFFLPFMVLILGAALISRFLLGFRSKVNQALAVAVQILMIYVITIVVYILHPWQLDRFLSPLPFVTFCAEALVITPFTGTAFSLLCSEMVRLVVLAFLVNLICGIFPEGDGMLSWLIMRLIASGAVMAAHLAALWAIDRFAPAAFVSFAPQIVLILLLSTLFLGLFKWFIGLFFMTVNPILGALYTFFFANQFGQLLSMSVLSTAVCCGIVRVLEAVDCRVICITPADLLSYIPLFLGLTVVWYLIGHEL